MKSGAYSSLKNGWVSSINQGALTGTAVPLQWAQESNAYDCVSCPASSRPWFRRPDTMLTIFPLCVM